MSCENCKCSGGCSKKVKSLEDMVKEGTAYLDKKGLAAHRGDFERRTIHFVFETVFDLSMSCFNTLFISVGFSVHNPEDEYSSGVGEGLAGYNLKNNKGNFGVFVKRSAWKTLNSYQKAQFVWNFLNMKCLMEELSVSRRAAMGGR